ncbi:MAG: hypothetical protein ABIL09_24915, partial [Gemmatimonadota bacterium]
MVIFGAMDGPDTIGAGRATGGAEDANLGIFDGVVRHGEVNEAIARAPKSILFGEQTRLPHFPEDERLPKLHAGEPLVLFVWKVLKKLPDTLRAAIIDGPLSLTLVRDDTLLCFRDYRHHQAVHIGRRRRTIYLPEVLLHQAEEAGYDYWAVAEGVVFAAWMLLDYLLLVDVLRAYGAQTRPAVRRLSEPYLRSLVERHNRHRRQHPETVRCEVHEFVQGYRRTLFGIGPINVLSNEPFEAARRVFDSHQELRWARDKMERVADVFGYPRMFLFDRDIIHGAARQLARRRGQSLAPACFEDALHDFRDAARFDRAPLMTSFCKGIVPKPRATFLQEVVRLGLDGLRGFFAAYRRGEPEALDLVHPLWMYLCSLSSDPAGVFARVGKCRDLGRRGGGADAVEPLAGILIRLDRAPLYREYVQQVAEMGETARPELMHVIGQHGLADEDEWATFKMKKQAIVACACEAMDRMDGEGGQSTARALVERRRVHDDEAIQQLLADNPHRHTSDPSGVLMYVRSYRRTLAQYGAADPDTNFLLASVLIRMDRSAGYGELLKRIPVLGPPAISALYDVLDQIPERDEKRRPVLDQARRLLGAILIERQLRARARQRAAA